jgi:TP901 family phage tail tape measure protein
MGESVGAIDLSGDLDRLEALLGGGGGGRGGSIPAGLSAVENQADKTGKAVNRMNDRIKQLWRHPQKFVAYAASWTAVYSAIRLGMNAVSMAVTRFMELETAVARVSIVTDESTDAIERNIDTLSKKYGRSVKEAGSALQLFAQQGIGFSDAVELTDLAMQGSIVTGDALATQVERLTGLYQGYKFNILEVARAQDVIISTQKRAGVTAGVLADAHIKLAASAKDMGLEFVEVNALVIGMAESMRLSGSEASRTLGMIFQRMFRPKTIETLQRAGIDVIGERGRKDPMEIFQELAEKFQDLPFQQQQEVVQDISGVRRGRQMRALMQGLPEAFTRAQEALAETGETARATAAIMDTSAEQWKRAKEEMAASGTAMLGVAKAVVTQTVLGLKLLKDSAAYAGGLGPAIKNLMAGPDRFIDMREKMIEETKERLQTGRYTIDDVKAIVAGTKGLGAMQEDLGPELAGISAIVKEAMSRAQLSDAQRNFVMGIAQERELREGSVAIDPSRRRNLARMAARRPLQDLELRARAYGGGGTFQRGLYVPAGGAAAFARREAQAVTPEQQVGVRFEQLREELELQQVILDMMREKEKFLSAEGRDESMRVELLALRAEKEKLILDMKARGVELTKESLRVEEARGEEAARMVRSMSGALEGGLTDILRRGAGIEAIGQKLGDSIGKMAVDKIMSSGIFNAMTEGIAKQGQGATFASLTGGQQAGALIGYGLMGYQQGGIAGAGLAAAGGAIGGPLGATIGSFIGGLLQDEDERPQWSELLQSNRAYHDASLEELRLVNRNLLAAIGFDFYALPGSYYYSQRATTGVQNQNLVFSSRDGIVNVARADLSHSVRSSMVA